MESRHRHRSSFQGKAGASPALLRGVIAALQLDDQLDQHAKARVRLDQDLYVAGTRCCPYVDAAELMESPAVASILPTFELNSSLLGSISPAEAFADFQKDSR